MNGRLERTEEYTKEMIEIIREIIEVNKMCLKILEALNKPSYILAPIDKE